MKFNYLVVIIAFMSSPLLAMWWNEKFPETLIKRYPDHRQKIDQLNKELTASWEFLREAPQSVKGKEAFNQKIRQFADMICEAARKEVINELTGESEFVIIGK